MEKQDHQSIGCDVKSCNYNNQHNKCSLSSIDVKPIENCSSGKACDESMCASYRHK